jgi:hypothetical protein
VDIAIRDANGVNVIMSALECLLTIFKKEPNYFAIYLYQTIDVFPYSGLLNTTVRVPIKPWVDG